MRDGVAEQSVPLSGGTMFHASGWSEDDNGPLPPVRRHRTWAAAPSMGGGYSLVCPRCGSTNIDHGAQQTTGGQSYATTQCLDCGNAEATPSAGPGGAAGGTT
jgi:hypothetical protein